MRLRRTKKRNKKGGAPRWMVTYSDMVTLVLVFFILLFSMSQIDSVKFEAVSESFKNRMIFDFFPSPVPMENPTQNTSNLESGKDSNEFDSPTQLPNVTDQDQEEEEKEDSLTNLIEGVESFLDEEDLHDVITANRTERGVVLVMQESILFDPGEAIILSSGEPFLSKIGKLLTEIPNKVKVEGHTDSTPMSSYRYPSNWELSGARASSVIRYIVKEYQFDENRFSLAGFGETKPVKPNNSRDNKKENRRVEIIILNETDSES